ncbi:hypothetical protein [Actinoallomurus sp. CA-150999]|uniref:hypothetical protein n=1 Tax=Actinoallomurus sp. CA-150999 TaxID=3239887 RepID=UPI003D91C760
MTTALEVARSSGDVGPLLKLVAQYAGASQTQLAVALETTQGKISKYINSLVRVEKLEMYQRIAEGIGMPDHARMSLGLAPRSVSSHPLPSTPRPATQSEAVQSDRPNTPEAGGTAAIATTAMQGLTAEITNLVLTGLTGGAEPGQDADRDAGRSFALLRDWCRDQDRLPPGVLHFSPGRLSLEQLRQLEITADAFRAWDHQFGGGLRRKAVIGQLSEVSDLLDEPQPSAITRRLLGITARLAITAAQMSDDTGHRSEAFRYLGLALKAAKEAGNHSLGARVANSMARKHLQSGVDGQGVALQLVQQTRTSLGQRLGPDTTALLITTEAWIHAHHGADTAVHRTLEEAAQLVSQQGSTAGLFGVAELAGVAGACFEVLAKSNQAKAVHYLAESERRINEALNLRDGLYVRSRALDFVGLANVHLAQGEVEQACQDARTAIDLAAGLRSPRVTKRLHAFAVGALELHPDEDGVWELAEYVRAKLPVVSM